MVMLGPGGIGVRATEVFIGPSSGGKPSVPDGAIFIETDTGVLFYRDGGVWIADNQTGYVSVTTAIFTAEDEKTIMGVNRAGVVTITLPSAEAVKIGRVYVVKDESGNASVNNITVDTAGAETIDGAATDTLDTDFQSIGYYSDGTNWFKV